MPFYTSTLCYHIKNVKQILCEYDRVSRPEMRYKTDICLLCVIILAILSTIDYDVNIAIITLQVCRKFKLDFFVYLLFSHRLNPSTMDYR